MRLTDAKKLALSLMAEHSLRVEDEPFQPGRRARARKWSFDFDAWSKYDDVVGVCSRELHVIGLSPDFVKDSSKEDLRNVILHEIAHALSRGGHGLSWRKKARELGVSEADVLGYERIDLCRKRAKAQGMSLRQVKGGYFFKIRFSDEVWSTLPYALWEVELILGLPAWTVTADGAAIPVIGATS